MKVVTCQLKFNIRFYRCIADVYFKDVSLSGLRLTLQIVCGQNCTFVIQGSGTVLACGEGSYGRLGQGNSDDLHSLTIISTLQGTPKAQSLDVLPPGHWSWN